MSDSKNLREVLSSELSEHNTREDLWLSVNGHVYNVTKFIDKHPGSDKPFLHFAGSDATSGFNSKHPNLDISKISDVVYIGKFIS